MLRVLCEPRQTPRRRTIALPLDVLRQTVSGRARKTGAPSSSTSCTRPPGRTAPPHRPPRRCGRRRSRIFRAHNSGSTNGRFVGALLAAAGLTGVTKSFLGAIGAIGSGLCAASGVASGGAVTGADFASAALGLSVTSPRGASGAGAESSAGLRNPPSCDGAVERRIVTRSRRFCASRPFLLRSVPPSADALPAHSQRLSITATTHSLCLCACCTGNDHGCRRVREFWCENGKKNLGTSASPLPDALIAQN